MTSCRIRPGTPDLDLTLPGTAGSINGAIFMTGRTARRDRHFGTFVQIQNNGTEQGYNTDANAQYDEKNSHNHNHSILLADVPIVSGTGPDGTLEGVAYREFLLDLNEGGGSSNPFLSLDSAADLAARGRQPDQLHARLGICRRAHQLSCLRSRCRRQPLDRARRRQSHGSGQSDYRILIPDSFFINDAAHRYVTLYSQFGVQAGWEFDSRL